MQNSLRALALLLPAVLFACNKHEAAHENGGEHVEEEGHTHEPLIEGGALIELGDHVGNLEVHLNPEAGELVIYLVDGHATDYVRSSQVALMVTVTPAAGDAYTLTVPQVASTLSGEKVGDSSKYQIQDDRLKGVEDLDAKVASVLLMGTTYSDVAIEWPAGDHDH